MMCHYQSPLSAAHTAQWLNPRNPKQDTQLVHDGPSFIRNFQLWASDEEHCWPFFLLRITLSAKHSGLVS